MKEILLTSSVLILALLLLRLLFRKTISRQVQYALWGLVALRLLVPVSPPASRKLAAKRLPTRPPPIIPTFKIALPSDHRRRCANSRLRNCRLMPKHIKKRIRYGMRIVSLFASSSRSYRSKRVLT